MQKKSIHFPQLYVYICYLMFFYPMSNNFEESYGLFFLDYALYRRFTWIRNPLYLGADKTCHFYNIFCNNY